MKIFLSHYRHSEYETELYQPLRESELAKSNEFIFPHAHGSVVKTKPFIEECDLVVAEVSHSATGVGIEIGWADAAGKPIVCFVKTGATHSNSLQFITKDIIEYDGSADLVAKLGAYLAAHV